MVTMSTSPRTHDRATPPAGSWLPTGWGAPVTQADLESTPWYGRHVESVEGTVLISPFTRAERDDLPDDGRRHELSDGTLVMSPSPSRRHQRAALRLAVLLDETAPAELEVFVAPADVHLFLATTVEPDLFVSVREDLDTAQPALPLPLLVIEVLSRGTRSIDLGLKKDAYARVGIADYWTVDPDEPSVTAWHLGSDGRYEETGQATGDSAFSTDSPFPVEFTPDALLA